MRIRLFLPSFFGTEPLNGHTQSYIIVHHPCEISHVHISPCRYSLQISQKDYLPSENVDLLKVSCKSGPSRTVNVGFPVCQCMQHRCQLGTAIAPVHYRSIDHMPPSGGFDRWGAHFGKENKREILRTVVVTLLLFNVAPNYRPNTVHVIKTKRETSTRRKPT